MATHNWQTTSVRLTEEEKRALLMICEKRGLKQNKLIRELIAKEIEPLLKPGTVMEGEGIPLLGEHRFKYNPDEDNYTWKIDFGTDSVELLADNMTPYFVDSLYKSITKAKEIREKNVSEKKPIIPKKLYKYNIFPKQ